MEGIRKNMNKKEYLKHIVSRTSSDSITVESLSEVVGKEPLHSFLREDEQPQFLLRGHILTIVDTTVPEQVDNRQKRKVAGPESNLLVLISDIRILVIIPRKEESEQITMPLSNISNIDVESAPGMSRRLNIRTENRVYNIDLSKSEYKENESIEKFISNLETVSKPGDEAEKILDTLERLDELRKQGTLTEAEFDDKKSELLDRI